ncbi:MAG TPA: response regulator [Candidatus Hydrogenedentes bacterium]|nr:response regulator [Candidatus Hydrogenedentota bacterium]
MARILVVDTAQPTAEHIARHLVEAGHEARVESVPERAVEVARAWRPDLFILDVMMPGVSGFELCRRIRRDPELYTVSILLLSAMSDAEERQHGLAQGADDFEAKPCKPAALIARVQSLLEQNRGCLEPDPLTGLPNAKLIRRELQKRISERRPFRIVYLEMLNVRAFGKLYGPEARDQAIGLIGRALAQRGTEIGLQDWLLGHTGVGHFVSILRQEDASMYLERVPPFCRDRFKDVYDSLGLAAEYERALEDPLAAKGMAILEVRVCAANYDGKQTTTPRALFDTLLQLRQKAHASRGGGVHVDGRNV